MRLLRPDLAPWGLVVPLIFACWVVHRQIRLAFARRVAIAPRFAGLSRRSSPARDLALLAAGVLAAAAIVFALVRPQARLTRRIPEYERQDLIIMLDRSASMKARDVAPSRFARATLEIRNFLLRKPDAIDRVGLVGFADGAVILSYLTRDVDSVLFYFDWIDRDTTPLFGTNIGEALESAMTVAAKDDRPTRKLLLVVSDGEDQGTTLPAALVRARAAGYHVHCIGIGSDAAVTIPLREPDGRETLLRDDEGSPIRTTFSERTLRQIAAATGGSYARSTTGDELQHAIAGIVDGERRLVGWTTSSEYRELYPAGLALAALAGAGVWLLR